MLFPAVLFCCFIGSRRRLDVIQADAVNLSAVRPADCVPALLQKRQQASRTTRHSIADHKHFVSDGITTLRLKKVVMSRITQNSCSTAHENDTVALLVLLSPVLFDTTPTFEPSM